jgi:tRNA (guanine26-N2/guanine27-N2)-dimethyltransferase
MELFNEGQVIFYAEDKQLKKAGVFFNPKREFDRDLNVLVVSSLISNKSAGLELFSGSGIRGLRLCIESNKFNKFTFNDIKSYDTVKRNLELNKKRLLSTDKTVNNTDATLFESSSKYDYIDIDPFGSPVFYLDSALNLLKRGGVLAVSATDTAALLGSAQKACLRKYGSVSLKTSYSNELGIRILIKKVIEYGLNHSINLVPILFNFEGNFIRVYFKADPSKIKPSIGYAYQCYKCPNRVTKALLKCDYCGGRMHKIGPMWLGSLHNEKYLNKMISSLKKNRMKFSDKASLKLMNYLNAVLSELPVFSYYTTSEISSFLKQPEIKISKFKNRTVLSPKGFRTKNSFSNLIATLDSKQSE